MAVRDEISIAKDGEFLREYGKQYFVVAKEAFGIGRVKWEMIPLGQNGKDGLTFYLTTEKMTMLCYEILNGTFQKKLAADTGAYPAAYKYITGQNGNAKLNIGGGKVGCRIQMQNVDLKKNYTMAVSVDSIVTMARTYLLCAGLMPVTQNTYYASVVKAFEDGRHTRKSTYTPTDDELKESNVSLDEAEPNNDATKEETNTSQESANENDKIKKYVLNVPQGKKDFQKGFYVFNAETQSGEKVTLMFKKSDAEELLWFDKFEETVLSAGTTLTMLGEKRDSYILYKGMAAK